MTSLRIWACCRFRLFQPGKVISKPRPRVSTWDSSTYPLATEVDILHFILTTLLSDRQGKSKLTFLGGLNVLDSEHNVLVNPDAARLKGFWYRQSPRSSPLSKETTQRRSLATLSDFYHSEASNAGDVDHR